MISLEVQKQIDALAERGHGLACLIICPYGRLQSAMTDRDTMVIGYDFNRWFGIDLSVENYEYRLIHDELGPIGEYSVFPITVQPRVRFPGMPPPVMWARP